MRLLVTRPADRATAFAAQLAARGHRAILAPALRYRSLPASLPDPASYDALLFTSQEAVMRFATASAERHRPALAVGAATAAALRQAGFAAVESAEGDAAALARLAVARFPAGSRLLHPCGQAQAGDLAAALAATDLALRVLPLYATRPAARLPAAALAALRQGAFEGAVFFSPKSAAAFVTLVERAGLATKLRGKFGFALSAAVAQAAAALPWAALRVAVRPNAVALLQAIDDEARRD